jgi:hypothetical protein
VGKDAEFQYLSDANARTILAAFQISPDELPGYNHLSRATSGSTLSEGSNEHKLTAAKDVGIRPLLSNIQDFLNSQILPEMDPEIAQYFQIVLYGLDVDAPEQEAERLKAGQELYDTFNDTLKAIDRPGIPKAYGGEIPLNPMFRQALDSLLTVGEQRFFFLGDEKAINDPRFDYLPNPFYFQQIMILEGQRQQQEQQAIAEQQFQQQQGADQGAAPQGQPEQKNEEEQFNSGIDQVINSFAKSEAKLPESKRKLLAKQNKIVEDVMEQWYNSLESEIAEIAQMVSKGKKDE